jgi:hypothetical protein
MAGPWFIDLENGNDANTGLSFAQRLKTFNGLTAAKGVVAGDLAKVMGSLDPTLVDATGAVLTQYSNTVTLSASVTQMIADCEAVWTASANVTATTSTTIFKEGTKSANLAIATAFTTGLSAFFATGTLDLSGYQQVSFWIRASIAVAASTLSLRLCSDVAGVTTVNTIPIPALPQTGGPPMAAVTVDLGAALGSSIKSIALYCDLDPGFVTINLDDIIACKASSAADSLSLTSMIGKVHNLSWVASTTYAANTIRRPTQANRNGFCYKVTAGGGGAAGGSEPTWPTEVGVTVIDGALTWTCLELEDTWFPIQSINGVTVKIDNDNLCDGVHGLGYAGTTETVALYKREPINFPFTNLGTTVQQLVVVSGTADAPIVFSGGWNRTDMATQTGETWIAMQNGRSVLVSTASQGFLTLQNFGLGRSTTGITVGASINDVSNYLHNFHSVGGRNPVVVSGFFTRFTGCNISNGGVQGVDATSTTLARNIWLDRVSLNSNGVPSTGNGLRGAGLGLLGRNVTAKHNADSGIQLAPASASVFSAPAKFSNFISDANTFYGVDCENTTEVEFFNSLIGEATPFGNISVGNFDGVYVYSIKHQQTANNHYIQTGGASIASATDRRHTPSGISWKFTISSSNRGALNPVELPLARRAIKSAVPFNVAIFVSRDSTNIVGALCVRGGQIAGVPDDVLLTLTPTVDVNFHASGNLTITPTEDGVVQISFLAWHLAAGADLHLWVDDISFS